MSREKINYILFKVENKELTSAKSITIYPRFYNMKFTRRDFGVEFH